MTLWQNGRTHTTWYTTRRARVAAQEGDLQLLLRPCRTDAGKCRCRGRGGGTARGADEAVQVFLGVLRMQDAGHCAEPGAEQEEERESTGALSSVGASILPQIGCLPLRDFLGGECTFSEVYKIDPMRLTTFWFLARNKKSAT